MLLHLSTWAEIEAFLERSKTVVIPIGSNEQHGPTGLLGTDWLCPEIIAHEAQKTADILVAPHLDFLAQTPEWGKLTTTLPHLVAWLGRMNARASFRATTWERVSEMAQAA